MSNNEYRITNIEQRNFEAAPAIEFAKASYEMHGDTGPPLFRITPVLTTKTSNFELRTSLFVIRYFPRSFLFPNPLYIFPVHEKQVHGFVHIPVGQKGCRSRDALEGGAILEAIFQVRPG